MTLKRIMADIHTSGDYLQPYKRKYGVLSETFTLFIISFFFSSSIYANPYEWNFERHYKDNLLYIHSLVNYELNTLWYYEWERDLIRKNGMKLSFGSVEINDLLCNAQVVINQDLGNGWWFRSYNKWYASQHKNTEEKSYFMGFEKTAFKNFSLFFNLAPAFSKEQFDANLGMSITEPERKKYFRVALCLDDFVYDLKNDKGGKTSRDPIGIQWLMRYGKKNLWFFSEGKYSRGFERNYSNVKRSPDMNFHQQQINNLNIKLYYHFLKKSLIELSFSHYHFSEKKYFYESEYDYSYLNEIYHYALKTILHFKKRKRVRLESHYVIQNSNSHNFKNYEYKRREFLPAVFFEYIFKKSILELGFMGSMYNWDYNAKNNLDDYEKKDYIDKVKLGWTFNFNKNARLQISISHVFSIMGFGGGNVQYLMFF